MSLNEALLFLYAQTPIHAGAHSNGAIVDLEIQRSTVTGIAQFNDSTVKGALKSHLRQHVGDDYARTVFGSDPKPSLSETEAETEQTNGTENTDNRSALPTQTTIPGWCAVADGHLVALPVQSSHDTFVWVTSALSLEQLNRVAVVSGYQNPLQKIPAVRPNTATVPEGFTPGKVILHDFEFETEPSADIQPIAQWLVTNATPSVIRNSPYWSSRWLRNLVMISDDDFKVLANAALDSRTHNVINETTNSSDGLFFSEDLPIDSLVVCTLMDQRPTKTPSNHGGPQNPPTRLQQLCELINGNIVWLGADQSNGHGALWAIMETPDETNL
jgi:CRISPR-associated protein Cmr4